MNEKKKQTSETERPFGLRFIFSFPQQLAQQMKIFFSCVKFPSLRQRLKVTCFEKDQSHSETLEMDSFGIYNTVTLWQCNYLYFCNTDSDVTGEDFLL